MNSLIEARIVKKTFVLI